jgi:hypothetical protein
MADKVSVPTIVNVADLRPRKYRNVLLHCTEAQLAPVLKKAEKVTRPPKGAPALDVISLGPKGYLLSFPCEPGCSWELVFKNGQYVFDCVCLQVPQPPQIRLCRFFVTIDPFRIGCDREGCTSNCRLRFAGPPNRRFICLCS